MERLGDLVHAAVHAGHRVVDLGLPGDAAHLANDKAVTDVVHHLDRGGDDVLLGLERLAEHVVEVGERVAAGDVERAEFGDRLAAQGLAKSPEVLVHRADLFERLDPLACGGSDAEVDERAVLDCLFNGVAVDRLETVVIVWVHWNLLIH